MSTHPADRDGRVALDGVLAAVDQRPTLSAYQNAARQIKGRLDEQMPPLRIALLSTFTLDMLAPYLQVEAARAGFAANLYIAPFNSIQQELLTPSSGCRQFAPDVVVLCARLGDLAPQLADDYLALDPAAIEHATDAVVEELVGLLTTFRGASPAAVLASNFIGPARPALGLYEPMADHSQTEAIRRLNARLSAGLRAVGGAYTFDLDRVAAEIGLQQWHDAKMWHLARAPISAAGLLAMARRLGWYLRALFVPPRKCVVVDLDNTLWGGVLGEAGFDGIKLDTTYPGSVYQEFQRTLLALSRRGVLLAINSKNNQADVDEVFDRHPGMVLRREHFAARQINWDAKPQNMMAIATELNIGIDSLVFFDDSPAECAQMRDSLPDVLTIQAPTDILQYSAALLDTGVFERLSYSDEDRSRTAMYRQQDARRGAALTAASLDDFLATLEMRADIRPIDEFAFPRAVDLIHKTNQFNATTRRHSAGQLRALVADPAHDAFYLRLLDRFGDNGIVGLAIVAYDTERAVIDTFLLSCRVIGRAAETALLSHLVDRARQRGVQTIEGVFIRTAKNAPAADVFLRHGFTCLSDDGGTSRWQLAITAHGVTWPSFIGVGAESASTSS